MSLSSRFEKLIHSKNMLGGIGLASFLESTVVPIPLEALLVPLLQKRRDRLWIIAGITTIGCILGALLGYAVGYYIFDLAHDFIMQNLTTEEQFKGFTDAMAMNGFWFTFSTGVTPVPLQIAMLAAGVSKYSLALYLLAVTLSRTIRYFGLAVLVYYFGDQTEKLILKYKWQVAIVSVVIVIMFFTLRFW